MEKVSVYVSLSLSYLKFPNKGGLRNSTTNDEFPIEENSAADISVDQRHAAILLLSDCLCDEIRKDLQLMQR
jgi:hypothetical protein